MSGEPRGPRPRPQAAQPGSSGVGTHQIVSARPVAGSLERLTGRDLILLGPDEAATARGHLDTGTGLTLQSVGGSDTIPVSEQSIPEGEGVVFHDLGVAVVNAPPGRTRRPKNSPPEELAAVDATVARSSSLYLREPERSVHTYGTVDLTDLRGYRDAVNHLYETMAGLDPATTSRAGASADVVYDESQLSRGLQATRVPDGKFTGRGVKVAVLDTGLDLTHPDFTGRTIVTRSFVEGEDVQDGNGHGTHCCGIACGARRPHHLPRYGVAYEADLYVGKVLNNGGRGTDAGIIAGIQWAMSQKCDIISMSLGSAVERGQALVGEQQGCGGRSHSSAPRVSPREGLSPLRTRRPASVAGAVRRKPMARISLNMSVSDPARFGGALEDAERLGLVVHAAYADLGIVSDSIDPAALPGLNRISGLTVEADRIVAALPEPGRRDRF